MVDVLPAGWAERVQIVFTGRALTLRTLGRTDLLRSKVFALCDRGLDIQDCVALAPTADELDEILAWVTEQDLHRGWPDHVRETVIDLRKRLGHAV